MHLFFLSRGMKQHRDHFVEDLANMYVPMKLKDKKGKETKQVIKVLLQPVELWSLVFPEENLDNILRTLDPMTSQIGISSEDCPSPKRKLSLAMLRKALGLKKIPKWDKKGNKFPLYKDNIQIVGIGIKEDYKNEYENECL